MDFGVSGNPQKDVEMANHYMCDLVVSIILVKKPKIHKTFNELQKTMGFGVSSPFPFQLHQVNEGTNVSLPDLLKGK